jgi:hypothetical protein
VREKRRGRRRCWGREGTSSAQTKRRGDATSGERVRCSFGPLVLFKGEVNSTQNRGWGLGIEDHRRKVRRIPLGIGIHFLFSILKHPNIRYWT